jgi:DNA-binding transcriptional ArsR family regulator
MATDPFSAIADERRRAILEMLRRGERSAGEIAARFDVSWPAISRHLRLLREAGLVRERRVGRERRYAVDRQALTRAVGGWVATFDARWARSLDTLRRQLESETSPPPLPQEEP